MEGWLKLLKLANTKHNTYYMKKKKTGYNEQLFIQHFDKYKPVQYVGITKQKYLPFILFWGDFLKKINNLYFSFSRMSNDCKIKGKKSRANMSISCYKFRGLRELIKSSFHG